MALRIITDSATDMPMQVREEYGFEVIPTPVVINGVDYLDGETIMPSQFYCMLRDEINDIKTYHVNQYMFRNAFEPYAKRGDSLIYFCFSTGIAGTYNAANLAKRELLEDYPEFDLTIIDGKCASIGFGILVYYAAQMLKNGADKDTIVKAAEYHRDYIEHFFTVETLDYLYRGGRLSRTSAFAGGLLDLKPIITVTDDGSLQAIEKVRGRRKSLNRLVEIVGEHGINLENKTIGIVHGDCRDVLDDIKEMLTEKYGCTKFLENYVGCAIGAHTGPGIIGITFLGGDSPYSEYFEY